MISQTAYNRIYKFARACLKPITRLRYGFTTDLVPDLEEPFLMLSNHTTEEDMFFTTLACRQPVHFVCGEHLLRNKLYGGLLRNVVDPVAIPKGGAVFMAVKQLVKRVKAGESFCMFPEGKRSYHGETIPAGESLGKLVKAAGCGLVTYRIEGGYFTYPRWARNNKRKGHIEGHVVGVYSSDQLSHMTAGEITGIINRDTYENAYERQRKEKWVYKGKNLAQGLDSVLFMCPECGMEDTIRTDGDRFYCDCCHMEGSVDKYGFLVGAGLVYDNVLDWMRWIEGRFDEKIRSGSEEELLYTFENTLLYEMDEDYINHDVCVNDLRVFKDSLQIGEYKFILENVPYMAVLYGNILLFTYEKKYYGLTGEHFKAWKCARLWHLKMGDTDDRSKEI